MCLSSQQMEIIEKLKLNENPIVSEATEYLKLFYTERNIPIIKFEQRLAQICEEVQKTGTYWQTPEEIDYGAQLAWRNSTRCIGRIFWNTLIVRDLRHLSTASEVFEAIVEHIKLATNNGKILSMISIFAPDKPGEPGIRIWNPLLIRYAGYSLPDGKIIGDPRTN